MKTATELVRLDAVAMDEDDEILPDFEAEVDDGRRVWVTAVLERTAVVEPAPGEPKVLVNRHRLLVESAASFGFATWRARRPRGVAARLPGSFACRSTTRRLEGRCPWVFPRVTRGRYRIKVLVSFATAEPTRRSIPRPPQTPPSPRKTAT